MSGLDVEPVENEDTGDNEIEVTPTDSVGDDGGLDIENADEATRVDVDTDSGDSIDGPSYVLYGGKGGVGKTTMAAATALDSARDGVRTLVVSTDPAHSLSDTFETDVPSSPARLRDDVPLWGVEIDPEAAMEAGETAFGGPGGPFGGASDATAGADDTTDPGANPFAGEGEGATAAGGPFGSEDGPGPGGLAGMMGGENPMEGLLGGTMPGADEAAAVQLLLEYLDDDRFDRVVVDTAPTGHTLRLLELPELLDSMVGKVLTIRQRIGSMIDGIKGMFGGGAESAGFDVEDLEKLSEQIERLRAALQDPERTDFRIVMVPEEMSVRESTRLREQLDDVGIPVGTVVVNRVMEPLADVTDEIDGDFLSPDLDDCAFCQRRWDVQQQALASAQDLFRGTDVRRVPLFADEVRGEKMLSVVAACLRR
ncbi:arsenite-activated ATPase ArsA [Halovivax ruber XH-70]|uniref:Arsenite-activated ATPase ArsA n=1 Tax=Halovivax ruber (strain DSM 18193 / JCM 13892 / XH-70) TaxID=797302 RepID=L0IF86_HALRX|nr:TRC40/GET3/ArsA family transport-energizing ATPase [Halovivax ruber]AGB16861.1 arsenite-activated ATPase ArsA [Halovivax ruber XH-70]